MPTQPLIVSPLRNMLEQTERDIVAILQALVAPSADLRDEANQPYSVAVRAQHSQRDVTAPMVVVELIPGAIPHQASLNRLYFDTTNQHWVWGVRAERSRILIKCRERNEATRRFLLDTMLSGILTSYAVGPPVVEAVILVALSAVGLSSMSFDAVDLPPPQLDAARPEGQVFTAVLPLRADVQLSWTTPPVTVGSPATVSTQPTIYYGNTVTIFP